MTIGVAVNALALAMPSGEMASAASAWARKV